MLALLVSFRPMCLKNVTAMQEIRALGPMMVARRILPRKSALWTQKATRAIEKDNTAHNNDATGTARKNDIITGSTMSDSP